MTDTEVFIGNSEPFSRLTLRIIFGLTPVRCHTLPVDHFRVVVWGNGVVYDGTRPEAMRQLVLFVDRSKHAKSRLDCKSVTLFKNFEKIREYHRPDEWIDSTKESSG